MSIPRLVALCCVCAVVGLANPHSVAAEPDATGDPITGDPGAGSVLATATAATIGLVARGSGNYLAGDKRAGKRLLRIGAAALGVMLLGAIPLGLTAAQRHVAGPGITLMAAGGGVFGMTWAADVYGAAGGARIGGRPLRTLPVLELAVGYAFANDPRFALDHFYTARWSMAVRAFQLDLTAWDGIGGGTDHVRGGAAWRVRGATASDNAPDGSMLEVRAAGYRFGFAREGFSTRGVDLSLRGRYDFGRLGRRMNGSFGTLELGVGLESVSYDTVDETDLHAQLLGRFGFGIYLGQPGQRYGEVELYYDNRRDQLAGGLALPGRGNGFMGFFGARGEYFFRRRIGAFAAIEVGSAHIAHLGLVYRLAREVVE